MQTITLFNAGENTNGTDLDFLGVTQTILQTQGPQPSTYLTILSLEESAKTERGVKSFLNHSNDNKSVLNNRMCQA